MNSIKPRFIIADPSLADDRGHHFSLTLQVTKGAIQLGMDCVWLVNKSFTPNSLCNDIRILPVFSLTMYDRYKPELKGKLPEQKERILFEELMHGVAQAELGKYDHIFCHTAFGDFYRAIPLYLSSSDVESLPILHLCTPYETSGMPGRDPDDNLLEIFQTLRQSNYVDKRLFLWAETTQLASDYVIKFGFNMRALPLPPPTIREKTNLKSNSAAFIALYLGAAREEKGFLYLPGLVEELYDKYGKSGKLKFIIQCTPQIIGRLPSIQSAVDKLSLYPESYVDLVQDVLDEDDYYQLMEQSNMLILLYDQKNYRIRGSGIAVEAISTDNCILTFKDTFCESLLVFKGGETIDVYSQAADKLAKMIDNKEEYASRARAQGQRYREHNCVRNYVQTIIKQPDNKLSPNFFPSNLIGKIYKPLLKI